MNSGEIDRLPVNQLMERYGIVKSLVYTRLETLNIKPERVGGKSFVNAEQIRMLDIYHEFIQAGGTKAEFLESRGVHKPGEADSGLSSGLSTVQPDIIQIAAAIAAQFAAKLQPPIASNPLAYFEKLEQSARNGWLLSTSEISELLDLLPSEIQQYGDRFSEAGFVFTKAGYRAGGQVAWRVSKPVK